MKNGTEKKLVPAFAFFMLMVAFDAWSDGYDRGYKAGLKARRAGK